MRTKRKNISSGKCLSTDDIELTVVPDQLFVFQIISNSEYCRLEAAPQPLRVRTPSHVRPRAAGSVPSLGPRPRHVRAAPRPPRARRPAHQRPAHRHQWGRLRYPPHCLQITVKLTKTFLVASVPPLQLKQEVDDSSTGPGKEEVKEESQPEVDIVINNVVCSFSVRCHLNLKEIALNGSNVEYRRENGMVTMKLR